MFGKRSVDKERPSDAAAMERAANDKAPAAATGPLPSASESKARVSVAAKGQRQPDVAAVPRPQAVKSDEYYLLKSQVFAALVEAIDVSQLAKMDVFQARDAIGEIVSDIV